MIDISSKYSTRSCIELFAGCGGLALGLHKSGWEGLFAIEKDSMAFETLYNNLLANKAPFQAFNQWPEWLPKTNHDLTQLLHDKDVVSSLKNLKGKVDLIAGGPPCQGFSVGGRRDGKDERNTLVYSMLELVGLIRPRAVLIENVEGIARKFVSKPGEAAHSVAEDVISRLKKLGYTSSYQVVDASDYGVPQVRKRVLIFGVINTTLDKVEFSELFKSKLDASASKVVCKYKLKGVQTVENALHDLVSTKRVVCPDSPKFESSMYTKASSRYAQLMRSGSFKKSVPDSHRFTKHGERILSLYTLAHETQPPGRLSKQFLLENGTKKDKKVLLDPSKPVATITTHPDEYIHYLEPRNITVREMARLQSFPDNFHFFGRYTINGPRRRFDVARCSQVGNAVPPLLAEGIGIAINEVLDSIDRENEFLLTPSERELASIKTKPAQATALALPGM